MVVLIIATALLQGLSSPEHVVSARAEVAALSTSAKTPITLARSLENKLVYVEPHGASPTDVLNCVALALNASVLRDQNGGIHIERTEQDQQELQARRSKERTAWLASTIERSRSFRSDKLKKLGARAAFLDSVTRYSQQVEDYSNRKSTKIGVASPIDLLPETALMENLCDRIGLETIGAIPTGSAVVYEDRPVASATALPRHDDLSRQFDSAAAEFASIIDDQDVKRKVSSSHLSVDRQRILERTNRVVDRLRLYIRSDENTIYVRLEGFDASGNRTFQTGFGAHHTPQLRTTGAIMDDDLQAKGGDDSVQLSAENLAAVNIPAGIGIAKLPVWYLHPESNEPLDVFLPVPLNAIAGETPAKCVAIVVCEPLWVYAKGSMHNGQIRMRVFKELISEFDPYERVVVGNSVAWRPIDPEAEEKSQADRKVLGKFVQHAIARKSFGIREVAQLYHDSAPQVGVFASGWSTRISSALGQPDVHPSSPSFFRLLGAISDSDWDRLQNGETTTVADAGVGLEFQEYLDSTAAVTQGEKQFADVYKYPTELFPNGMTDDVTLSLQNLTSVVSRAWATGQPERKDLWLSGDLSDGIATIPVIFVNWTNNTPQVTMKRESFDANLDKVIFRKGARSALTFRANLPNNLLLREELSVAVTGDPETFSFAELPQQERDAIWLKACQDAIEESARRRASSQNTLVNAGG